MVGLLHPGEMGAVVGGLLRAAGHTVLWASEGRSAATRARAEAAGLEDAGSVADVARRAAVILSICPPHAALATALTAMPFGGTYVDANAVSPATARAVGEVVRAGGGRFVDGGIVGPPPTTAGTSRLYLSGDGAAEVAALFAGTSLEAAVVDGDVGAASALKMAYAAWTKGTAALLLAADETARAEGVEAALHAEWTRSQPELAGRLEHARRNATTKGWRWIAEMEEIAATFGAAGQPDGFHRAAADVYRRWSGAPQAAEVVIDELGTADEATAERLLDDELGGRRQARLGEVHDVLALPGLAARRDGRLVGIVTYERASPRAELAALAVQRDQRNRGIGAALVEAAAAAVRQAGAGELWLVTTNDNLDALRLYQRHGFRLTEIRPAALEESRRRKPQIPLVGDYGIPLRDELVLEGPQPRLEIEPR